MSDREPEIVEVGTVRLGPSRRPGSAGARRPASVVLVLLVAIAIPALAFVGPRVEWRPEIDLALLRPSDDPSPSPSRTPRPPRPTPAPTASPLPALTIGDGERPGRIPIDVGGLRFVDTRTGGLTAPGAIHLDSDAAFAVPGGGWWCICFKREQVGQEETVEIEVRHLDRAAAETARFPIRTTRSSAPPPSQDLYTRFDVELGPDARTAYLVSGVRSGGRWTVALESLDLASGTSLDRVELGAIDVPPVSPEEASQGYEPWFGGPTIRLSPDGRRLVTGAWVERPSPTGEPLPPVPLVWLVDVGGGGAGSIDRVAPTTAALHDVYPTCAWALQWLTNESLIGACWPQNGSTTGPPIALTTYAIDGTAAATIGYTPDQTWWSTEPILDRANRVVYYWSPMGHLLDAIDLATGRVDRVSVDPDVASATPPTGSGPRSEPDWATFSSDYVPWSSPQLLAEPGGGRLFALGLVQGPESEARGGSYGSSGIWVFDAATLRLLDRWPAAAAYGAIRLTRDGRWMLAVGQQDADSGGNRTAWPLSITVHDARDGRMALQAGNLGRDQGVLLPP